MLCRASLARCKHRDACAINAWLMLHYRKPRGPPRSHGRACWRPILGVVDRRWRAIVAASPLLTFRRRRCAQPTVDVRSLHAVVAAMSARSSLPHRHIAHRHNPALLLPRLVGRGVGTARRHSTTFGTRQTTCSQPRQWISATYTQQRGKQSRAGRRADGQAARMRVTFPRRPTRTDARTNFFAVDFFRDALISIFRSICAPARSEI